LDLTNLCWGLERFRVEMYSLTGDAQHICRVVDPDGRIHRKKGGGWLCRRWTDRPMPRDLVNHTIKEWEVRDSTILELLLSS
jgi:hypothetical protein